MPNALRPTAGPSLATALALSLPLVVQSQVPMPVEQPEVTVTGQVVAPLSPATVADTVLTRHELETFHLQSAAGWARRAPNFSVADSGSGAYGDVLTVRGLTNSVFFGPPAVAVYVDDVAQVQSYPFGREIPSLESVDLLRGAQPYATGFNSYGGLLNIRTHQPTNEFEGEFNFATGSYDLMESSGWVSAPLVRDLLFFKIGGGTESREGYLKNNRTGDRMDSVDRENLYGGLYWRPEAGWDISLTASMDRYRDGPPRLTAHERDGFYEINSGFKGRQDRDSDSQALRISYEADSWKFLSVTSRQHWQLAPLSYDADFLPSPDGAFAVNYDQETWSQELRWQSNDPTAKFQWSVGAFGSTGEVSASTLRTLRSERRDITVTPLSLSLDVPRLGRLTLPTVEIIATSDSEIFTDQLTSYNLDEDSAAFFTGGSWSGWEPFTLHAGARVDWVRRTIDREKTTTSDINTHTVIQPVDPLVATLPLPFPPFRRQLVIPVPTPEPFDTHSVLRTEAAPLNESDEWVHVTPTLGLDWKINPDALLYIKTAYAAKPGGYSAYADDARLFKFDAEKSWSSEIGLKSQWFEGGLVTNLAGFYNRIKDYQYERGLSLVDYVVLNADEAETYGVEFEARWQASRFLDLSGAIGYTHAEFTKYSDPITGQSLDGNQIPYVPQYNAVLTADLHFENGLFLRAEYLFAGQTTYDDRNRPEFVQDDYGIINAAAGWRKGPVTLTLYGTNLAGEEYYTNISTTLRARAVGAPREYGVRMTIRF